MSAAGRRVLSLDLLRVVAAFQMVQGHTLDAVLDESHRHGWIFDLWTWMRGLTAVAFLTASGMAFYLAVIARAWEAGHGPVTAGRRVRRALLLIGIGYALHLPAAAAGGDAAAIQAAFSEFLAVDVLQCIGISLLVLEGLVGSARRASQVVVASALVAVGLLALLPWATGLHPQGPFLPVLNYVSAEAGSLFPLVPWAGYLFAGVVLGALAWPRGRCIDGIAPAGRLAVTGLLTAGAGITLGGSVGACALRLGAVVLGMAGLALMAARLPRLPQWAASVSRETLVVYVFHIVVVYAAGLGLADAVGRRVPLMPALLIAALLVGTSFGLAVAWERGRARRPLARAQQRG